MHGGCQGGGGCAVLISKSLEQTVSTPARWKATDIDALSLSLPDELVEAALALGIDIPEACRRGLQQAVADAASTDPSGDDLRTAEAWNDWVERNGLPFAELRRF